MASNGGLGRPLAEFWELSPAQIMWLIRSHGPKKRKDSGGLLAVAARFGVPVTRMPKGDADV